MGVTQSAHERPLSRGTFGVAQVVKPRVVGGGSSVVSALSAPVDADADVPAPPDTGAAAAKAVTPAAPSVPVVHKLHAPGCDLVHGGGAERRDVRGAATAASPAPKGATRDPETPTADSQAASKLACSCDADPDRSATILIESKTAGKESSVEEQDVQRTAAVVAAGAVATVGGQVRAGRHPADVTIPDDSMRRQHLLCSARDRTTVHVRALAKTYHLIGQGRFSAGLHKLVLHQVVKMGACSVQVTELCLDDASPDVAPAAGEEAPCGSGGDVHVGAGDGEGDGAGAGAGAGAETAAADDAGCASDAAVAAAAGSAPAPPVPAKRVCYICWEDSTGEGTSELVASPCVCNNHVHRKCLLTWLESRAMRECPVCKTTLPCGAVVPPPYIVLRVVRHMRNHVWAGRKEFVIGFAGRESNAITIGSSDRCDVPLPDPSVSRSHARVSLRDGEFYVEDLSSSGGTYLRLMTSSTLSLTRPVTLKAGRSTLALRVAPVPASPTDDKAAVSRSASRAVTASTAPVGAAPPVPPAARTTPRHRVVYRSAQSGADVDGGEAHGSAEAEGVGPQATDVPPAGRASKTRFARLWALRKSSSK